MVKWEYKIIQLGSDISIQEMADQLNKQGNQGWELVEMLDHEVHKRTFVFKRTVNGY